MKFASAILLLFGITSIALCDMTEERFWKLIDESCQGISSEYEQASRLSELLKMESKEDIIEFDRLFTTKLLESNHWDLWAVAYIINGGCSDDGFIYFRCWLIGQGQSAFENALNSPTSVSDLTTPENYMNENEVLMYSASMPYEAVANSQLPINNSKHA